MDIALQLVSNMKSLTLQSVKEVRCRCGHLLVVNVWVWLSICGCVHLLGTCACTFTVHIHVYRYGWTHTCKCRHGNSNNEYNVYVLSLYSQLALYCT